MQQFNYIKDMMTRTQLINFLPDHPSVNTIKKWVFCKKIPFHKAGPHKNSKVWFIESEIRLWQEWGRPDLDLFEQFKINMQIQG